MSRNDEAPTEAGYVDESDESADSDESGAPLAPEAEIDDVPAAPDEARREFEALNDRHLRLAAEFDNYRKRTERERAETRNRAQAELATGLLDVLDDLQRVAHVEPASSSLESLLEGVQLVERKLQQAMTRAGLEPVDAEGLAFDPATMEALMTVDAEGPETDDQVAGVLQKGYRFKGHLLRPARVQVRKYQG